jgi:hypothetical protein
MHDEKKVSLRATSDAIEGRFIAAVVKDSTDALRSECCHLPGEVFESHEHRKAWRAIVDAPDYDTAALAARSYFAHETAGESFAADRLELFLRDLRRVGLHKVEEWKARLPAPTVDHLALDARLFDIANPPPPAEARFYLRGVAVWTAANLGALSAAVKSGKSAATGAQIGAVMLPPGKEGADCLGFTAAANTKGHAVIHLDTEQAPDDHHALIKVALARAGITAPPPWLLSYCLTGMGARQARAALPQILERAAARFGGIHSVFVDGVADLAEDVNDPKESNALVAEWHALAIRYHAPLVGAIHVNPGKGNDKTRGHLGSQLERKAGTNMRIEKEDDGVAVIFAEKNRKQPIFKRDGVRFAWDERAQMHVTTKFAPDPELIALARDVFDGEGEIGANAAIRAIREQKGVSDGTAKNRWREVVAQGIAIKSCTGKYHLAA